MAVVTHPMRWSKRLFILVVIAAVLSVSAYASATVMKFADLARLVEISDVIVMGKVVKQTTYHDKAYGQVVTDTVIDVERSFHGKVDTTVQFQQWGGDFEGQTRFVPGDAQFEPYEKVIVFLADGEGKDKGLRFLSALGQSKYTVHDKAGKTMVIRDLHDLVFLVQNGDEQKFEGREPEVYEFASFVAELESLIAGIKGGQK